MKRMLIYNDLLFVLSVKWGNFIHGKHAFVVICYIFMQEMNGLLLQFVKSKHARNLWQISKTLNW